MSILMIPFRISSKRNYKFKHKLLLMLSSQKILKSSSMIETDRTSASSDRASASNDRASSSNSGTSVELETLTSATLSEPINTEPIPDVPIPTSTLVPTEPSDPDNAIDPISAPSANTPKPSEVSHEVIHEDLNDSQSLEEITSNINLPHASQIIGELTEGVNTRANVNYCLFACFVSKIEPKKVEATQDELLQLERNNVWTLTFLANGKIAIRTKWVFHNKKDENGVVIRNKARLVAQGYCWSSIDGQ
ncbi:LOW QUALITY PROTEIN: hypothetical protein OSB04_024161 [Centaurea solstitialis]|uniref:Reverse transcriptase Ty1/copia-type domain-containing protein n=1 Tax=Centaurea solstitialis TaxID=347529 RepID=A0AA38SKK6_9ASTR|nr:LOW QUALITY PROTEIN: hypothetical protein OSB04_024161 [Centaurea solstitialis]